MATRSTLLLVWSLYALGEHGEALPDGSTVCHH